MYQREAREFVKIAILRTRPWIAAGCPIPRMDKAPNFFEKFGGQGQTNLTGSDLGGVAARSVLHREVQHLSSCTAVRFQNFI